MGARRPSGRPGARWLRVDRKPLSTEPGPHPGHTSPTGRNGPPVAARALSLAPSGGARCGTPSLTQRRCDECAEVPRSGVRWWTRPNLPAPCHRLSTAVWPAHFGSMPWSGRRIRRSCDAV